MALLKESQIKEKIRLILESLQRQEILASVIVEDFKKGILDRDYQAFPVAILQTAGIQNETITNSQNFRTYTFDIVVLLKGEDVQDATTVEELRAKIMDTFDSDPTLTTTCDGGVMPASSPIEPIPLMGGKSLIAFTLTLECRAIKDLTFV
jgi:hypothetical protein